MKLKAKGDTFSLRICYLLSILMILGFYLNPKNSYHFFSREITFDMVSYYLYLPLTIIQGDIGIHDFSYIDGIMKNYQPSPSFYQAYRLENGNFIMNYTCGFALLYLPFFLIGHLWAWLADFPMDGFSFPYQFSIAHGAFLMVLPGVYFLRKVLLEYVSDRIAGITLLILTLSTNYFHETFNDYIQPHAVLFTAYALLLWLVIKWHKQPSYSTSLALGALMAWMILARPSEILCLIIPLLWNVCNRETLLAKWKLLSSNYRHLLLMLLAGFLIGLPQMLYWKLVAGKFLFYSYGQTEGFDFDGRYIWKVLFSFKKSWFIYTPVIVIPLAGVFLMRRFNRSLQWPVLVFILSNFYLLASWAAWWNGGSFGMRYFVESYAVLALPWAYINRQVFQMNKLLQSIYILVIAACTFINLFQTWQYVNWIIPPDRMTKEYYKRIFLKTKVSEEDRSYMEIERSYALEDFKFDTSGYRSKVIGYLDFDSINTVYVDPATCDTGIAFEGRQAQKISPDQPYSATVRVPHHMITEKDHAWIRVSVHYLSKVPLKESPVSVVITYDHEGRKNLKYRGFELEALPNKPGEWNFFTTDWMTPFPYDDNDPLVVYVWNRGSKPVYIDRLKVEAFEKR